MRKLVVSAFVTLDGVMQAPGGPEEDPTGYFTEGGWSVGYWDDAMNKQMAQSLGEPFDLLLGRKTYEIFAAHWPYASAEEYEARGGTPTEVDDPAANALNTARKYVASRTLDELQWNNSVLLKGDVAKAVAALKKEDGPKIQVQGSAELIQTLLRHELVDEVRVWIFPVVVGSGKRLFGDGTVPAGMQLVECVTSGTGVLMAIYEPAGEIRKGSFAFDEPTPEEVERRSHLD